MGTYRKTITHHTALKRLFDLRDNDTYTHNKVALSLGLGHCTVTKRIPADLVFVTKTRNRREAKTSTGKTIKNYLARYVIYNDRMYAPETKTPFDRDRSVKVSQELEPDKFYTLTKLAKMLFGVSYQAMSNWFRAEKKLVEKPQCCVKGQDARDILKVRLPTFKPTSNPDPKLVARLKEQYPQSEQLPLPIPPVVATPTVAMSIDTFFANPEKEFPAAEPSPVVAKPEPTLELKDFINCRRSMKEIVEKIGSDAAMSLLQDILDEGATNPATLHNPRESLAF